MEDQQPQYPPSSPVSSQKEAMVQKDGEKQQQVDLYTPPDGGLKAWSTVAGAWFILFGTYGYLYAFGVYQDYYTRIYLTDKTPSDISWIGSLQFMMPFFLGVVAGKLFDQGIFYPVQIIGGTIYVLSIFMLSLAKTNKFYQVFLAQGVGMGVSLGMIWIPVVSVHNHHFRKRRAFAGGIVLTGAAFGAVVFPIMLNQLFQRHSFGSAVRGTAYLVLGCVVVGNLLMRTRLPPGRKEPPPIGEFFKETSYLLFIFSVILMSFGLLFPGFYMQNFAVERGLDRTLAFYTLAIINAASIFGRLIGNRLADSIGPITLLVPASAGTSLAIWLMFTIHNSAALVIVSIIYGFFSGAYLSLGVASLGSLAKVPAHIGAKTGIALTISSFSFLGSTPAQGALLTSAFHWARPIVFSGTMTAAGTVVLIYTRHLITRERGHQRV